MTKVGSQVLPLIINGFASGCFAWTGMAWLFPELLISEHDMELALLEW